MPSYPQSKDADHGSVDGVTREQRSEGSISSTAQQKQDEDSTIVHLDLLAPIPEQKRVCLAWENISAFVPGFTIPTNSILKASKMLQRAITFSKPIKQKSAPPKKQILFGIGGYVHPGEVAALMGPSGSGKTTLISILGGRAPKMITTEGSYTFNGHPMSKAIRRSIGYVSQDDLLYENLTVYETLYYAALLRLPKSMTREQKLSRVEAVIQALGLDKCRDTLIGGPLRRGVSGGERKRVSVGHELLINPSVLVLDEPTSGLDSTTATHLISTLKSLAAGGRAIITTIHQPSSRIYRDLDTVMLLSEGRILYYGGSTLTVDWFHDQRFDMPYGVNIAEYILDIANGDIEGQGMNGEESRAHLVDAMTHFLASNPRGFIRSQNDEQHRRASKELHDFVPFDQTGPESQKNLLTGAKKSDRWGATFPQQCLILFSRAMRNRRFSSMSSQTFFQTIGCTVIVAILYWMTGDDNTLLSATDVSSVIFFVLIYVAFTQLFKAIHTFPDVFNLMVKERTSGMYRLSAFYLSETLCDLPMDYSIPLIFIISVYWAGHLRRSVVAFLSHVVIQLFSALTVQTIGLVLGAMVRNSQTAISFSTVLMIAFMLVSGFWVREIPSWIEWVQYIAPPYWGYRVLMQIEFGNRDFVDCGGVNEDQLPREECKPIEDLADKMNMPFDLDGSKWPGVAVIFAMLISLRILTYYVLRVKTRFTV